MAFSRSQMPFRLTSFATDWTASISFNQSSNWERSDKTWSSFCKRWGLKSDVNLSSLNLSCRAKNKTHLTKIMAEYFWTHSTEWYHIAILWKNLILQMLVGSVGLGHLLKCEKIWCPSSRPAEGKYFLSIRNLLSIIEYLSLWPIGISAC